MQGQGISLPVEKLSYAGEGVNFLTAHGSKGLQFDHVFMLGCTSGAWDGAGRSRTYSLPPTIWTRCSGSEEEESRRLFYVAMTRARRQLVISWPQRDNNDKELEQSRFVAELTQCAGLQPENIVLPDEALLGLRRGNPAGRSNARLPQGLIDTGFVDTPAAEVLLKRHPSQYLSALPAVVLFQHPAAGAGPDECRHDLRFGRALRPGTAVPQDAGGSPPPVSVVGGLCG